MQINVVLIEGFIVFEYLIKLFKVVVDFRE